MKKIFLAFFVASIFFMSPKITSANYEYYYSTWASNLFGVIETSYSSYFYPHVDTQQYNLSTGGTYYYRLYDNNNGLLVYVAGFQHDVYYMFSGEWYYLDQLHKVDSWICSGTCKPSNNSSGYNYWDDPDYASGWCYGVCSWNYSTHECECP